MFFFLFSFSLFFLGAESVFAGFLWGDAAVLVADIDIAFFNLVGEGAHFYKVYYFGLFSFLFGNKMEGGLGEILSHYL